MKKVIFLLGGLLSSLVINAQILSYSDAAVLFSTEKNNGTARFNAMSGAFGALGGDLSAGNINPAGMAVFNDSEVALTLGNRNTNIITSFYGPEIENENDYFNLSQAGGVWVYNNRNDLKVALGFNYSLTHDFENSWFAAGNSEFAPLTDLYDPDLVYGIAEEQSFNNFTTGRNDKFVFSLAAQSSENVYFGVSINTHSLDLYQLTTKQELNNDGDGNTFDVFAEQELETIGDGVSFSIGTIIKPSYETRIGLTYQSPTWYELSEARTFFDHELTYNESDTFFEFPDGGGTTIYDYQLRTPSKLTGSFAYVFGKEGLISFDYSYNNFKNIKLKPTGVFNEENTDFNNFLRNTSSFRVGAEWRIDNFSLRGGYHFEESPYDDALDSDNITGYSFGAGFKFSRNFKLDFAYQNSTNTDIYNFQGIEGVDAADLDIDNKRITATLVLGF